MVLDELLFFQCGEMVKENEKEKKKRRKLKTLIL